MAVAATFVGGLGNLYLSERIGRTATHVVDALIMVCATYGQSYVFVTAHEITDVRLVFGIGLVWAVLAVGLELLIGRAVFGEPWARLRRVYNIKTGRLYSMMLLVLLISPDVASLYAAMSVSRPSPQPDETPTGDARVMNRVFWVAMTQVILYEAQIVALIGEVKATTVPQHVGVQLLQARTNRGGIRHVVDSLASHGLTAFVDEKQGQEAPPSEGFPIPSAYRCSCFFDASGWEV